jgi:hypothetical protein
MNEPENESNQQKEAPSRPEFLHQVKTYDIERVFADSGGRSTQELLDELFIRANDFFGPLHGPLTSRMATEDCWIRGNWEQGRKYHYAFEDTSGWLTPLDGRRVLLRLDGDLSADMTTFTWLFSQKGYIFHWNASRRGEGIKSLLKSGDWRPEDWAQDKIPAYISRLNDAINSIRAIELGQANCVERKAALVAQKRWKEGADLSVLFHLVWPQYFPVHYQTTGNGYSQTVGMRRLLNNIALNLGLHLKDLNYYLYADYSAAYRVLLAIYDSFIQSKSERPPHFDFLTQLLAEREGAEAEQLLRMKKALVLYGVPGTGKTHMALYELLPALTDKDHRYKVQFHSGFSYADFMTGIRPNTDEKGQISYSVEPGILYRLAAEAALSTEAAGRVGTAKGSPFDQEGTPDAVRNPTRSDEKKELPYALFIDEINRADLARVFGEVLFCIEYRGKENDRGEDNTICLPHVFPDRKLESVLTPGKKMDDPFAGGAKFFLPENLYIVGAMNQADRSIGAFDAALRRRFAWYRLDFSTLKLEQMLDATDIDLDANNRAAFVERAAQLNRKISGGYSKDKGAKDLPLSAEHTIGHTYFAEIISILDFSKHEGKITEQHLERLWLYFIEPLLEDALGFEAAIYRSELDNLRDDFIKKLP